MTEQACSKSEIDLFRPIDVQVGLTDGRWQTYYPLNSLTNNSVIEFIIPGTSNEVIDMNNTSLYLRGTFKNNVTNFANGASVFPANNLLHSMIRSIDVSINGRLLTRASKDYAYKDMFLKLTQTNMPLGGQNDPQLIMEGFSMDTAGNPAAAENTAIAMRKALIVGSREFELRGNPCIDLFQCDRSLLMGCDINLKIHLNEPSFYMMDNNATVADRIVPTLTLVGAELKVRRVTVADTFVNAINNSLKEDIDAIYPFTRREMLTLTIPQGTTLFTKENLFRGQLGVRYFFAMVNAAAYQGTIATSPFYFQHFNINEIQLLENGQPIAEGPVKMNFTNKTRVVNAYHLLLESIGAIGDRAMTPPLTLNHFCDGHSIFCFTRSPDLVHGLNHLPNQSGNLTLQMNFSAALPSAIMVVCMAEFDARIQINSEKNIVTNYAV